MQVLPNSEIRVKMDGQITLKFNLEEFFQPESINTNIYLYNDNDFVWVSNLEYSVDLIFIGE